MLGIATVAGPDSNNLGGLGLNGWVGIAQLRGVFSAEQSAEMAQENQHYRPALPELAQLVVGAGVIGKH